RIADTVANASAPPTAPPRARVEASRFVPDQGGPENANVTSREQASGPSLRPCVERAIQHAGVFADPPRQGGVLHRNQSADLVTVVKRVHRQRGGLGNAVSTLSTRHKRPLSGMLLTAELRRRHQVGRLTSRYSPGRPHQRRAVSSE